MINVLDISGNVNITEMLLENGATNKNIALTVAASYDKIDIVEYLLQRGADIDTAGYGGQTALHNAAGNEYFSFQT